MTDADFVAEILTEIKLRAAANRKSAASDKLVLKGKLPTIHTRVCERTALELERLATWIEMQK
jgi:hypothetical protein